MKNLLPIGLPLRSWMLLAASSFLAAAPCAADEGMWTYDNPPLKQMKDRYGFEPAAGWLDRLRLASLRFNDGGSGSFVSGRGLVLTNHHVALGQLQKVSSEGKDYVRDGFFAKTREEELKCPDLELNQLVSMEQVTSRILAAVPKDAAEDEKNEARKSEMARVEKESMDKTGLRSDVVELYQGGEYWLYRYKKYTDIRLVMAPEFQAAFYGGDYDNFTYPRHDLDFALFRVYEDGKPVRSAEHFPLKRQGAADRELVFVSGHPGRTERLKTLSQLEYSRDLGLPARLKAYRSRIQALRDYSARGAEEERRAKDRLFGYENGFKAVTGYLEGLRQPSLMALKTEEERTLRSRAAVDPALVSEVGAWDRIALAQRELTARHKEISYARIYGPRLYGLAEHLVLMSAELQKPNEKRYEEYRDSALESLRFKLFTPAPFYPDLEEVLLAASLRESLSELGPGHPWVQAALGGRTPEQAASEALRGSKLFEAGVRKQLAEGGFAAVRASSDPLLRLALRLEPQYRQQRKWYEDRIESVEALEGNKLAKIRFAVLGKSSYPDATFTLRLSYGKVAGYEKDTTLVPPWTNFHGLYGRSASFSGKPPFDLPAKVREAGGRVDLSVPLDFVTTNDIIGGNSGSPVVDKEGRLVGLIFDGNIESLVLDFLYTEERGRAIAVHAGGILEGLRAIYGMPGLADELEGR